MQKPIIAAALAITALAGCKVDVEAKLFTSDLIAVVAENKSLTTPMIISVEAGSSDGCEKARNGLLEPLKAAYGEAEFIGCESENFEHYARFRVPVDVVHELVNQKSDSPQPIYIGVTPEETDTNMLRVDFFQNREASNAFANSIPKELSYYIEQIKGWTLAASISNDLSDDIKISVNDVFADGLPIQKTQTYDLPRRGEVNIKLSDVSNAAFGSTTAWVLIAKIPLKK